MRALRPPCLTLDSDLRRSGNLGHQVYHLHPNGGLPGGLVLAGDGFRGSGKSQRRGLGRLEFRPLENCICFFCLVNYIIKGLMVPILCSLLLRCICVLLTGIKMNLQSPAGEA